MSINRQMDGENAEYIHSGIPSSHKRMNYIVNYIIYIMNELYCSLGKRVEVTILSKISHTQIDEHCVFLSFSNSGFSVDALNYVCV